MSFGKLIASILLILLLAAGGALYWLLNTVRWQDAYEALGVVDPGPQAIALAMADGEVPQGMPTGERVHAWGSLLRIRYEVLDGAGSVVATHELRALAPALPAIGVDARGGEYGELECRDRCRKELAAANAAEIVRGGTAGLSEEWLLRMPVGKSFELTQSDLKIQDIAEDRLRTYPVKPMRVTVLAACKANVRIGTASHLDFGKFPPVRSTHWAQLEGCSSLMAAALTDEEAGPPPPAPPPEPILRKSWVDRADWESVRPRQDGGQRWAVLMVDEDWLARRGKPRLFHLLRSCQFNAQTRQWAMLPKPEGDAEVSLQTSLPRMQRIAYHFPKETALFFAEWTETEDGVNGPTHRILMPSGADSCREDSALQATEGNVVACAPQGGIADQQLVPDPLTSCGVAP